MTIRARESVSMNAHNIALFIVNARIDELPKQFNSSFIASIDKGNDDESSFKLHDDNCECELCINNEWSNSNRAKAGMK